METDTDTLATSPMQLTEVGWIPENWKAVTIGEISHSYSGGTPATSNTRFYGGEIPFISSGELNQKRIIETEKYITTLGLSSSSAKIVDRNTLLIALYGATAGVSAITEIKGAINQAVLAIELLEHDKDLLFFWLQLNREKIISTYTQGGQPNLSGYIIRKLQIPLPPTKAEQTAIATALGDADALIEHLEQLIAKKRLIKQGAMRELLTPPGLNHGLNGLGDDTDGEGEAQQEIRAIRQSVPISDSDNWEVKTLGEMLHKVVGGGTPSRSNSSYWNGNIPWMTVKDFATFNPNTTQEKITLEGLKNSSSNLIPSGTLIISTRMALGKAVIYNVNISINQDLKALFINSP